jgi:hypothetical protein
LQGVRDLIAKTDGGILITGREHYFNNNEVNRSGFAGGSKP